MKKYNINDKAVNTRKPDILKESGGSKLQNIEIMRFIGMLLIMGHHLYHIGYLYGHGQDGLYLSNSGWVWVDFFFILTGAFTYNHYTHKQTEVQDCGSEGLRYTFHKFRKFLPYTTIAILLEYVMRNIDALANGNWKDFFLGFRALPYEVMYLSASGIISHRLGPIWFLSAMFIVLPLIVYIMNKHPELWKILAFICPIVYFGRMGGINGVSDWPNYMLRAFACISLGSFAYMVSEKIGKRPYGTLKKCMLTFFEVSSCMAAVYISFYNVAELIFLLELLFFVMVTLMLSGVTYSSTINFKFVKILGEISMPMFVFHWVVGSIVVYFTEDLLLRAFMYYAYTIIISVVVGIPSKQK